LSLRTSATWSRPCPGAEAGQAHGAALFCAAWARHTDTSSSDDRGDTIDEHELAKPLAVHEAVCAERRRRANARLGRIEAVLTAIVLLLLLGEGSAVEVLKRLLGG
jgi:hypothetical protein